MNEDMAVAGHLMVARITQLNNQQVANPQAPQAIAAGISATALGAYYMLQAGVTPPIVMINPILGR